MERELHLWVDAALDDEVASLLKLQRYLLARLLVAGIESELVRIDERVMDGIIIAVDEGNGITPAKEQVCRIVVPTLLQYDPYSAGNVRTC
ncbi:hypothetical protein [Methylobacterium sp. J-067]|uniref:hypothetical protein n=1 Tax=Methylobacterium sp. J-067 TaxID=2836648 RepID=UPI001FBACC7A|nr:hypothetical protein [Methylobacterium sp. J-067]MCJ2024717.1 hypothetical protein [Methylobacterium sp. J-067]